MSCGSFSRSNLSFEWMGIENIAVFPCKNSAFSKSDILNKIMSLRLVVLYKYMNYTVDVTTATGTGTGHTTYLKVWEKKPLSFI